MSTQTKPLSAATVLSTLGGNDKIVAVTEAGATGLVSKGTLRDAVAGPTTDSRALNITPGEWIRVAKLDGFSSAGIVFVTNTYNNCTNIPLIIQVGSSHDSDYAVLTAISSSFTRYSKVRLVQTKWDGEYYVDAKIQHAMGSNIYHSRVFGIGIEALTPSLAPSVDDARWVKEAGINLVGGGRNRLIYNPLKAVKAERRAA